MTEGAGHAPAPGHDPTAGHGPTVLDMLEHSQVAPLLHMPVGDILMGRGITLPHLPPMPPLPHLPPLPTIDLAQLFKPLTDLLAGFGSGNMASAPFDPTKLFSGLQQAFESVTGLGTQAISMVAPFWAGAGGTAAVTKGVAANGDGVATGTQSGDISRIVGIATASVAKGVALLEGVIASFAASVAAAMPAITTPFGIAAIMGSASTHLTEGLGVVAATRAELTAHTANMTFAGHPIPITAAPQVMSAVPGVASSAVQAVSAPVQSIAGAFGGAGAAAGGGSFTSRASRLSAAEKREFDAGRTSAASAGGSGGGGGAVPGLAGLGGLSGGAGSTNTPFSSRAGDSPMSPGRVSAVGSAQAEEVVTARGANSSAMTPGGMPMGGAGASASGAGHSARDTPVDARYADDVVGEVPTASPSVLGDVEAPVAQSVWDSPDELES